MFDVKSVDETIGIINESFSGFCLETETVDIRQGINRVTALEVKAEEEIPGFNRSSVDGYAVISSDTFGASDSLPAQLRLAGEVRMGEKPTYTLEKGQVVYVPTGGELPEKADAVIMIEYTENYNDGFIYINKPVAPGNNVVFRGDDIRPGAVVIPAGRRLRPQDIGAAAAVGCTVICVKRMIRVGIISTGDEIVEVGDKPKGSRVRDINSYSLYGGLVEYGAQPILYGITGDEFEKLREIAMKALNECDVVLISGGSSVGAKDETYRAISSLGEPGVLVHGIAVKPGKPTIIGKVGLKAVVGLPGHPASAYMIYRVFVERILDAMNGLGKRYMSTVKARLACNYPSNSGREEFIPVRLELQEGEQAAWPVFGKSGLITSLSSSDGYIHLSRSAEGIERGSEVEVYLF